MRQLHDPGAVLEGRGPLGVRELARGPRAQRAQGLRDRSQRPEVGTGADDDLRAALAQCVDGLGEVAHRLRHRDPVGDVVAADDDHRHVGSVGRRQRGKLGGQRAALRAHHRRRAQPDRAPGPLRHSTRQPPAEGVLGPLGAESRGDGVPEDHQVERVAVGLAPVLVAGRRVLAQRLADGAPGLRRLAAQHLAAGVRRRGERGTERGGEHQRRRRRTPSLVGHVVVHAALDHGPLNARSTAGDDPPTGTPQMGRRTHDAGPRARHAGHMITSVDTARPVSARQLAWLRGELDDWAAQGLVSDEQAARLSTRYRAEAHRPVVGRLLLLLGGGFVGVGLIWLVAANLDQLSPGARLGAVAAIWLALLGAGEALDARRSGPSLVGALRLLAALAFGALVFQAAQSLQVPAFEPRLIGVWSVGALLHGYLTRAYLPFVVGVTTGVAWWFAQPLWEQPSGLAVVVLLGAGAVLASSLAVLHDARADAFAWTWRTLGAGMALAAVFVAAIPDVGSGDLRWNGWLASALAAAATSLMAVLVRGRSARRALEPVGAVVVLGVATGLALWRTGSDTSSVDDSDWLHAAVSVGVYVLLAVGLLALGTVRDHRPTTWMATGGLVVFTTFQGFAVFAPIVTGAWLFVVLGTVFLGTGFLVDRARRGLTQALDTEAETDTDTDTQGATR